MIVFCAVISTLPSLAILAPLAFILVPLVPSLIVFLAVVALAPITAAFNALALTLAVSLLRACRSTSPLTDQFPVIVAVVSPVIVFSAEPAKSPLINAPPLPSALEVLSALPEAITFNAPSKVALVPPAKLTLVVEVLLVLASLLPLAKTPPIVTPWVSATVLVAFVLLTLRAVTPTSVSL